jgi:hypothetical protein
MSVFVKKFKKSHIRKYTKNRGCYTTCRIEFLTYDRLLMMCRGFEVYNIRYETTLCVCRVAGLYNFVLRKKLLCINLRRLKNCPKVKTKVLKCCLKILKVNSQKVITKLNCVLLNVKFKQIVLEPPFSA